MDKEGVVQAKLEGNTSDLVAETVGGFQSFGILNGARFWDVNDPYLYHVILY